MRDEVEAQSGQSGSEAKALSETARRKPYRKPRLERLGTLTEITATVGSSGKNDHPQGPGPLRKTT
jgi:hypothetical protein